MLLDATFAKCTRAKKGRSFQPPFSGRGKNFHRSKTMSVMAPAHLCPGKANGVRVKKLTIRLFSRSRNAHSSEDKAASKGTHLTSDFAGPDDASGVRAADERLQKGDWLLDADARKGPLSRRFRQTRYGGHVEPLRITGSSICSRLAGKHRSFIKVGGFSTEWSSRLPESTGFSWYPGRAETTSGLRCTKT